MEVAMVEAVLVSFCYVVYVLVSDYLLDSQLGKQTQQCAVCMPSCWCR